VLDPLGARQVADWLGSHLTNTKFGWPFWEQWKEVRAPVKYLCKSETK
jgi:hypothetical protein